MKNTEATISVREVGGGGRWGSKKFEDWGGLPIWGVTFAGEVQYPITCHGPCLKIS